MDIVKFFSAAIAIVLAVSIAAFFGGTIVWLLWPVVGIAFPSLITSGAIAGHLSWWDAVSITWLFSILIKASQTNSK